MQLPGQYRSYSPLPFAALVLAISAVGLSAGLGSVGLLDNNEGINAEIGREMLDGRSFVIPTLNGLPYIEKPPLLYWALASSYAVLGVNEFAARVVPLGAAMLQLALLVWFGRRVGTPRIGVIAAAVLATSVGFFFLARAVMIDLLLSSLLNAALMLAYLALRTARRQLVRYGYAVLALAVLTKGWVALALFGLIVGAYLALRGRDRSRELRGLLLDPPAIAVFVLVVAPWHIAATLAEPGFAWFYFVNEHVLRFLGQRQPADFYTGSVLYHVPRVLALFFPWSAFLPLLAVAPNQRVFLKDEAWFWLLAFVMPFAFFSLSAAKANYYMIVGLPALAWLIAAAIDRLLREQRARQLALPLGALVISWLVLAGIGAHVNAIGIGLAGLDLEPTLAGVLALCVAALATTAFLAAQRGLGTAVWVCLLALAACGPLYAARLLETNEAALSSRSLVRALQARSPAAHVALYRDFEWLSSVRFYLNAPVQVVDTASNDLRYGLSMHPAESVALRLGDLWEAAAQRDYWLVLRAPLADEVRAKAPDSMLVRELEAPPRSDLRVFKISAPAPD